LENKNKKIKSHLKKNNKFKVFKYTQTSLNFKKHLKEKWTKRNIFQSLKAGHHTKIFIELL